MVPIFGGFCLVLAL